MSNSYIRRFQLKIHINFFFFYIYFLLCKTFCLFVKKYWKFSPKIIGFNFHRNCSFCILKYKIGICSCINSKSQYFSRISNTNCINRNRASLGNLNWFIIPIMSAICNNNHSRQIFIRQFISNFCIARPISVISPFGNFLMIFSIELFLPLKKKYTNLVYISPVT